MDIIERMEEAAKYGNNLLLKASEQAGFLSAALIASISFWKSSNGINLLEQIAFISLCISIFMSIFTHFSVGKTYVSQIKKLSEGKAAKSAFSIYSGWVFGTLQILFLIISLCIIFYLIGTA